MKEGKVSVVMCTYNGAKYIEEQVDSIINQSYPIYELIIQDDCSTDNTCDILKKYAEKYSFIRIFRNENKKGINENFFSAMERAAGDYIAISDQDDIWEPDKIEQQMAAMGNNWLCSGFSKQFAEKGAFIFSDNRAPNYGIERQIYHSPLWGHTLLLKREMLSVVPKEYMNLVFYDRLLGITAAAYNKIAFCTKTLVNHRRHTEAASYTRPLDYRRTLLNYFKSGWRTFCYFLELKPTMRAHFFQMYLLLKALPEKDSVKADAQNMALYQSQKGFMPYIKLTLLCVKARNKIFHTKEKNRALALLRAIYFPISCSDYFRYASKSYPK